MSEGLNVAKHDEIIIVNRCSSGGHEALRFSEIFRDFEILTARSKRFVPASSR